METTKIADLERRYPKVEKGVEGYVYVIRESNTTYYKIGLTNNPKSRMANLSTGNPRELIYKRIIKVVNNRMAEDMLHYVLEDYHISGGGGNEWFEIPPDKKQWLYDLVEKVKTILNGEEED